MFKTKTNAFKLNSIDFFSSFFVANYVKTSYGLKVLESNNIYIHKSIIKQINIHIYTYAYTKKNIYI